MKMLVLLTAAMITTAAGATFTIKLLGPAAPTMVPQSVTISIEDLHGQMDLTSLPEQKFEDLI